MIKVCVYTCVLSVSVSFAAVSIHCSYVLTFAFQSK